MHQIKYEESRVIQQRMNCYIGANISDVVNCLRWDLVKKSPQE